jgi:hypothetical protein
MFQMIKQAYGEEALGCSFVFMWNKGFEQGRVSLEDDEYTGQLRTVRTELKIQEVATLVSANCYQRGSSSRSSRDYPWYLPQHSV